MNELELAIFNAKQQSLRPPAIAGGPVVASATIHTQGRRPLQGSTVSSRRVLYPHTLANAERIEKEQREKKEAEIAEREAKQKAEREAKEIAEAAELAAMLGKPKPVEAAPDPAKTESPANQVTSPSASVKEDRQKKTPKGK